MTIAACFVTAEGVVLGADSTVTITTLGGGARYYNHAQKVFQLGESLGVALWGDVPYSVSYRTLLALLGDRLAAAAPASVEDAANQWGRLCWERLRADFKSDVDRADIARDKQAKGAPIDPADQQSLDFIDGFSTGFCVGGWVSPDRTTAAFEIDVTLGANAPVAKKLDLGYLHFWGAPNILRRVLWGFDFRAVDAIIDATRPDGTKIWSGTEDELFDLAFAHMLRVHPNIPIREAVDLVHFSIQTTIKALKFSHFEPTCGGPIEIATITSDRDFRWVRHKQFDAAL